MFKSNLKFFIRETIPSSFGTGDTFEVSTDLELGAIIDTDGEEVSIVLKNEVQIERMVVTIADGVATIVTRGLIADDIETENEGLKKQWTDGEVGYITGLAFNFADLKSDNSFKGNITIADTKKIQFGSADAYIYSDDAGLNLKFKDGSNNEIDLSTISALSGADTKVAVTTDDTTPGSLDDKIIAGDGISRTINNPAGDETYELKVDLTDANKFSTTGVANRGVVTDGSGNLFQATETKVGGAAKSTDEEASDGVATNKFVTPAQTVLSAGTTETITKLNAQTAGTGSETTTSIYAEFRDLLISCNTFLRNDSSQSQSFARYYFEISDDNINWTTLDTNSKGLSSGEATDGFIYILKKGKYVRGRAESDFGGTNARITLRHQKI